MLLTTLLSSCQDNDVNSTTTKYKNTSKEDSSEIEQLDESEYETFKVIVTGFDGEALSFNYENESYLVDFSSDFFVEKSYNIELGIVYSNYIINNEFGIEIEGQLKATKDLSKIISCDVISPNGKEILGNDCFITDINKNLYTIEKENSNGTDEFVVDLNALNDKNKLPYATDKEITFEGFQFNGTKNVIARAFYLYDYYNEEFDCITYAGADNSEYYGFFGTIQSLEEGKLTMLLNDGITLCTIPTYYKTVPSNLEVGAEIVAKFSKSTDVFGSGESKEYDFAVIYTNIDDILKEGESPADYAYMFNSDKGLTIAKKISELDN